MRKLTTNDWIAQARAKHGLKYDYSKSVYEGADELVTILCPEHGEFQQRASRHLAYGCKACGDSRKGSNKTLGGAEVLRRIHEVHGSRYTFPRWGEEYAKVTSHVTAVCSKHGPFRIKPVKLYGGQGCRLCGRDSTKSAQLDGLDVFVKKAREVHGDRYSYSSAVYVNATTPLEVVCREHGPFQVRPNNHVNAKSGCPRCAIESRGRAKMVPFSEFVERSTEVHGLTYSYHEDGYSGVNGDVQVSCPTHGTFTQRGSDHIGGHGCGRCSSFYNHLRWSTGSLGQQGVAEFVQSLGLDVEQNVQVPGAKTELDIYVPSCNLAIEYHGVYFHSSKFKRRSYHKKKMTDCRAAGIRLIQIFSDEWANREEAVKLVLANALKVSPRGKGARSFTLAEVDTGVANAVYQEMHILGETNRDCTHMALMDGGEPVAVMSFSSQMSRGSTGADVELVRFCNPGNVTGAASRLFRGYVLSHPGVMSVLSFSDNRWYTGESYRTLGFTLDKELPPDYSYAGPKGIVRINKAVMQKERLAKRLGDAFDPNLSERENCERAGFYQVFDAGKIRWRWVRTRA